MYRMIKILTPLALIFVTTISLAQADKQKYAKELAENGDTQKALTTIDEVIATNSPRASYYHDKVNYLIELKDYEGALKTLSAGIDVMPDSASLYDMRGTLHEAFRMYNEAIQDFTMGFERAKENVLKSHLLSNRGGAKARIKNFEGAYSDLTASIKLDPGNIDALNNLAAVCDEVNKPNETLIYLEKIISINPGYAPAYVNIGFRHQKLGQHKDAIAYFNKAIAVDANQALAYSNRSFSKLKTQDLDGAMKDINHSITLMPSNSFAYKIRALIQIEKKMPREACLDLTKATELGYDIQYGNEVKELIAKNCNE
jgi:tetratricopeptide (TPR) repeat protein